ncbi:MAG: YraN family protein [Bacteroidota bacterium]
MKEPRINTREAGGAAERIAQDYLAGKGYRILMTNWYCGHLELDIIAQDGDELVIVEVKSRRGIAFDHPSDALSNKKMRQIIEAAGSWIDTSGWEGETRFDLITIVFTGQDEYELEHYEEAFNPEA